jgi:hypothetical protein
MGKLIFVKCTPIGAIIGYLRHGPILELIPVFYVPILNGLDIGASIFFLVILSLVMLS